MQVKGKSLKFTYIYTYRDAAAAQAHRGNTDFDTKPKLYQSNFCKTNRRSAVLDTKTILQTLTWIQAEKL